MPKFTGVLTHMPCGHTLCLEERVSFIYVNVLAV